MEETSESGNGSSRPALSLDPTAQTRPGPPLPLSPSPIRMGTGAAHRSPSNCADGRSRPARRTSFSRVELLPDHRRSRCS